MFPIDPKYHQCTLMAIDPGLNNLGIAIFTLNLTTTPKIAKIQTLTIQSEKLIDDCGLDDEDWLERHRKRHNIASALKKLLAEHRPAAVVSESPFFNPTRPNSFAVLTEVMATILDTLIEHDPNVPFSTRSPQEVKKAVGVAGVKGKDVVKEAVRKLPVLTGVLVDDLDTLSDHAVDAIAVGYCHLTIQEGKKK
jgi:Holliday junction resolvasome RuvABC endonuclease subunit